MLFDHDRDQLRRIYCQAWACHCQGQELELLQAQIVTVVRQHPEYHAMLENPAKAIDKEYLPELGETNPFLHMGMHLAIQEQVGTDRPPGIRGLYNRLLVKIGDAHQLEHRFMDCLANMLWQAQKEGKDPDEQHYLDCLRDIAGSS